MDLFLKLIIFVIYCVNSLYSLEDTRNLISSNASLSEISETIVQSPIRNVSDIMLVKKCCASNFYYSTITNNCEEMVNNEIFEELFSVYFGVSQNVSYDIKSGKIDICPGTLKKPRLAFESDLIIFNIMNNGHIKDSQSSEVLSHSDYCLEVVGTDPTDVQLTLAYCFRLSQVAPKCCPDNQFFDTRILNCVDYPEGELNTTFKIGNQDSLMRLSYQHELECENIPIQVHINESYFQNDLLCITKNAMCYDDKEFCMDNMVNIEKNDIEQSIYLCPNNFINKCCPDGQVLSEEGCIDTSYYSTSILHILMNTRYHVQSISNNDSNCKSVVIEENESNYKWTIDPYGYVEIIHGNKIIQTYRYCIDDFTIQNSLSPVLKVCSEELESLVEDNILKTNKSSLRKCCPHNTIYQQSNHSISECIESISQEPILEYNLHQSYDLKFPQCDDKIYHKYYLDENLEDFAKITDDLSLKIISQEGNCLLKQNTIDSSKFCLDFTMINDTLHPIAIVCAQKQNFHEERNIIIVCLLLASSAAMVFIIISLTMLRVRRGMVTVKKINTLAGQIMMGYAVSLLIGYISLSVGNLVDFEEKNPSCLALGTILMYFVIASFCWNTSICLEGLLLTLHIRTMDSRRYLYHSLWAWGTPFLLTGFALYKDIAVSSNNCDVLRPRFGYERCFFSDPLAQLLYFYCPIAITVLLNALFLIVAKLLRRNKLRNLKKDPQNDESVNKVLSVQSINNKIRGQSPSKALQTNSGPRTHYNNNLWIESVKLALWSGITWIIEIVGFVTTMYVGRSKGEWYQYLWYLPVSINCLRGLGIFFITMINSDNKTQVLRTIRRMNISLNSTLRKVMPKYSIDGTIKKKNENYIRRSSHKNVDLDENYMQHSTNPNPEFENNGKSRSASLSTVITNISSGNSQKVSGNNNSPSYNHSISMVDSSVDNSANKYENSCLDEQKSTGSEESISFSSESECKLQFNNSDINETNSKYNNIDVCSSIAGSNSEITQNITDGSEINENEEIFCTKL